MLFTAVAEITRYFFLLNYKTHQVTLQNFLSIFYTVYRGTPYDVLRNPGWETDVRVGGGMDC
jgi:hypothetical protein